jgi:hypothetical protein
VDGFGVLGSQDRKAANLRKRRKAKRRRQQERIRNARGARSAAQGPEECVEARGSLSVPSDRPMCFACHKSQATWALGTFIS